MKKETYMQNLLEHIQNNNAKELIKQEIECHIDNKIDYYVDIGYSVQQAEEMAIEEMGNPDQTAIPLNTLHSVRWYKKFDIWAGFALVALQVFFIIFYPENFKYTDKTLCIMHFITVDFVSLIILAAPVIILYIMLKHNSLTGTFFIVISLILGFISNAYEPAFYAAAKICSSGFSEYVNSIFGYSYVKYKICNLSITSIIIPIILFAVCLWTVLEILRAQQGKNTRKSRNTITVVQKIILTMVILNLILMSTGSMVALFGINQKIYDNKNLRKSTIDLYIKNYANTYYSSFANLRKSFEDNNYKFLDERDYCDDGSGLHINLSPKEIYTCNKDNILLGLICNDDNSTPSMIYVVTSVNSMSILNSELEFEEKDFEKYTQNLYYKGEVAKETSYIDKPYYFKHENYTNSVSLDSDALHEQAKLPKDKRPCTLEEFLEDNIYYNAVRISKTEEGENQNIISIDFEFKLKNSKYENAILSFSDGILTNLNYYYEGP